MTIAAATASVMKALFWLDFRTLTRDPLRPLLLVRSVYFLSEGERERVWICISVQIEQCRSTLPLVLLLEVIDSLDVWIRVQLEFPFVPLMGQHSSLPQPKLTMEKRVRFIKNALLKDRPTGRFQVLDASYHQCPYPRSMTGLVLGANKKGTSTWLLRY